MTETKKIALAAFKRHPDLQCVHVCLGKAFSKLARANNFKRAWRVKSVTSILRTELAAELGEQQAPPASKKRKQNKL